MPSLRPFLSVCIKGFLVLCECSFTDGKGACLVNRWIEGETTGSLKRLIELGLEAEEVVSRIVEVFLRELDESEYLLVVLRLSEGLVSFDVLAVS